MIVFGPVPSRRLGRSLGVNNIPPKTCTYACVYCQVGRTTQMTIQRQSFYSPEEIQQAVEQKIEQAEAGNESIDYITIVPDGEPTLDINLEEIITNLKSLGYPVAIISNASLVWMPEVRETLSLADWVSLKVDAVQEPVWHKTDRPHKRLDLAAILEGIQTFAQSYSGTLATETMLVRDTNDGLDNLEATAAFLGQVQPNTAYISVPTRPPTEPWVRPPTEETLHLAYQVYKSQMESVEYLISYEGNEFVTTDDVAEDLLSITSVHPMREDAVLTFLRRANTDQKLLDTLIEQEVLARVQYKGQWFYMRRFNNKKRI